MTTLLILAALLTGGGDRDILRWEVLPPLPDPVGLAGPVAGVSGDALLVGGGANFPGGPPWDGHPKVWHDRLYVLPDPGGTWKVLDRRLPRPTAYGVSLTWKDRILVAGGGDAGSHFVDVVFLSWAGGSVVLTPLPPLPRPCAFAAGVLLGDSAYIAGGAEKPDSADALRTFWRLDLARPEAERSWTELPPWPGPGRMLPVLGARDGNLYLFSGARLYRNEAGEVTREFLTDAYRFDPGAQTWDRLADSPRPIVAAPGPALPLGTSHLALLSGDDGRHFFEADSLRDRHPGFPPEVYTYNTVLDAWAIQGRFPEGELRPPVTTSIAPWRGGFVLPTGEARPGVRTAQVLLLRPAPIEGSFGAVNWTVLGGYLLVLVWIGVHLARRRHGSTEQYFLAGRRIPWWAAGISIFGTTLSAITYLSIPARVFAGGWGFFILNLGIVAIAPLVVFVYVPLLRRLNLTTAYEYLEHRFSVGLRLVGSASFIVLQLARMGVVILLPALALSAVTGLDVFLCIAVMGVLSTLYTVLGGIEAVIWTDVLQVGVLIAGAVAALVIVASDLEGGLGAVLAEGWDAGKFAMPVASSDWTAETLWVLILGAVFSNALVPYTTDQTVIQRYLATPDEKQAARAVWTNAVMVIPATFLFFMVGTALFVFYRARPELLHPLEKSDQLVPWFLATSMPTGLAGLVIAGVFAAAMSSLDSSMHAAATAFTTDFVRRFSPGREEGALLRLARGLTIGFGLLGTGTAMLMATADIRFLWDYFIGLMGLFGGTLAGLFALGIFVRRTGAAHAWCGVVASFALLVVVHGSTDLHPLLYGVIGTGACVAVGAIASLALPGKVRARPW